MTGSEIGKLVAGAVVAIDTPLGKSVSVRFDSEGRMTGEAGELASYLGSSTDKGRWWIAGNELCQTWSKWFSREEQCLTLKRQGQRFRWTNQAGTSGTAAITTAAKQAPAVAVASAKPAIADASRMRLAGPRLPTAARAPGATKPVPSVSASPPATAKAAAEPEAETGTHRVRNVDAGDVLNIRNGPSAETDVIGSLAAEQRGIKIAGTCQSQWCPITHAGVSGWVNVAYIAPEADLGRRDLGLRGRRAMLHDSPEAPRACLTEPARAMLDDIEKRFGPVRVVSTCRAGATIAGTGRPSRHASGNAVDFDAGARKEQIIAWLIANHKGGGTMTYPDMDHIHVDIGRHFVSLAGRRIRSAQNNN